MTCKDCIHYGVCWKQYELLAEREWEEEQECCIEQSRYIELPCKVGDTVYIPNIFLKKVYKYRVDEINIGAGNNNVVVLDQYISDFILPRNCAIYFNQFGKTVFLTKEEAEKALAERSENNG